jgi:hypothetical protein
MTWTTPAAGPLARFCVRPPAAFAWLGLTFLFVLLTYVPLWHTDVWGHLRFGEAIVVQRRLPTHEEFSGDYADQQADLVPFQWLTQATAYLLFDFGRRLAGPGPEAQLNAGALALTTAHAVIVTLRAVILLLAFRRLTGSTSWSLAGVALAVGLAYFHHLGIQRPQAVGELAFAALLLPLSRPTLSRRAVVLIPLLFALWVNVHGSYLTGLALLAAALVGRAWDAGPKPWRDVGAGRMTAALFLSLLAAAFANPYGPGIVRASLALAQHPNIASLEEWKPLPLNRTTGYAFLATLVVVGLLLYRRPTRFTATQLLLLVGFGLETLIHRRVFVWYIMAFTWAVLPHLKAECEARLLNSFGPPRAPDWRWSLGAALGVPILLTWSAPAQWALTAGDSQPPSVLQGRVSRDTPVAASRLLREAYEADVDHKLGRCIFTSETMGEFLLWDLRLEPPVRIFCYTHVHLLTPEHWRDCLLVKFARPGWQDLLDREGVQFVVVETRLYSRRTGFSDLVDQIRADPERWQVLADEPVFVARRTAELRPGR